MFTIRTLISKSLYWGVPAARGGIIGGGVHSAPLIISASTAKKYTEDHEAVVFDDSTSVGVVSITDYAQSSLGDVVFVELPALKTKVTKGG
jgi:glycine cleavage system H protein